MRQAASQKKYWADYDLKRKAGDKVLADLDAIMAAQRALSAAKAEMPYVDSDEEEDAADDERISKLLASAASAQREADSASIACVEHASAHK